MMEKAESNPSCKYLKETNENEPLKTSRKSEKVLKRKLFASVRIRAKKGPEILS